MLPSLTHTKPYESFLRTITPSIKNYGYYVDWEKINHSAKENELYLHMLNYLIGKSNIKEELRFLLKREPKIIQIFPLLLATREKHISIFDETEVGTKEHRTYNFSSFSLQTDEDIDRLLFFLEKTGLIAFIEKQKIRNFNDYVYGLEVGMDTHARKNRGGNLMEHLVESYIEQLDGVVYLPQASHKKIEATFNITLHPSLQRRIFDFVLQKDDTYFFIESNFFNDGGTKLKSVAGEFKQLQQDFHTLHPEHHLIWVTDGNGWTKSKQPLKEAFEIMDCILNIYMLENQQLSQYISTQRP